MLSSQKDSVENAISQQHHWTAEMDLQLTQYANQVVETTGQSPLSLTINELTEHQPQEALYPAIHSVPMEELHLRFSVIQQLNHQLAEMIRLADLSSWQLNENWSLGHKLSAMRYVLFNSSKIELWNDVLQKTGSNGQVPSIQLNRRLAAEDRDRLTKAASSASATGDKMDIGQDSASAAPSSSNAEPLQVSFVADVSSFNGIFAQAFHQLNDLDPQQLRNNQQAWNVHFEGESGVDVGGVFRDSLTEFCDEICSSYFPLFIKTPNAQDQQGSFRDSYVPNPSPATSTPLALAMFEFVGKLMGAALRTKELLPLNLPSMIWNRMVNMEVTYSDLEKVDILACRGIDVLRNDEALLKEGVTEENFHEIIGYSFTTHSTDGREVELIPGGKDALVTWKQKAEYADLLLDYRLHEFELQIQAMKNGLDSIVPTRLLALFTPQELELAICGRPDIDLEILKKNTKYNGCNENTTEVKFFWEALRSFSQEERSLFLRFVWGRARLPVTTDWPTKFTLRLLKNESNSSHGQQQSANRDSYLPSAHTCFFSLDLPAYSSAAILREKLLKAITMCTSVENI
ncbi:HECT domain-containing protein [Balamuthia mandrillaris]